MLPVPWQQFIDTRREERERAARNRILRILGGAERNSVTRQGQNLISFASNDSLGLASHPALRAAAAHAARDYGVGSGASRLVSGTHELHAELEHRIAQARGSETALLFTTGYQANTGVITALGDADTLVVSDELNHASIIDGCRLARAKVNVFSHRDYARAQQLLAQNAARKLLISDTLFSMTGDFADIPQLIQLARDTGALLMLDDAHGFGALGSSGRGVPEIQGVAEKDCGVVVGTFSKALGSLGGYACVSTLLREHLLNEARSFMFSTAGSIPDVAASIAALDITGSAEGKILRETLSARVTRMRKGIAAFGLTSGGDAHIIPVILGDEARAVAASAKLEALGYLVPAIRPPAVPKGQSLLRISVSAAHTEEMIDGLLHAMRDVPAGA